VGACPVTLLLAVAWVCVIQFLEACLEGVVRILLVLIVRIVLDEVREAGGAPNFGCGRLALLDVPAMLVAAHEESCTCTARATQL
jgi:hypothetical protein